MQAGLWWQLIGCEYACHGFIAGLQISDWVIRGVIGNINLSRNAASTTHWLPHFQLDRER